MADVIQTDHWDMGVLVEWKEEVGRVGGRLVGAALALGWDGNGGRTQAPGWRESKQIFSSRIGYVFVDCDNLIILYF